MEPANDPGANYKALVRAGYDRCAKDYEQARLTQDHPELDLLIERLPPQATVLDIGCGSGLPVARALARQAQVTGVDLSAEMVHRARENVPAGRFIQADIMALDFPVSSFEAVVAFYSIFHLPREEHPLLLRRIHAWLKPSGYLLATVTRHNEAAYLEDNFFGVTMYFSNFSLEKYDQLLTEIGFRILDTCSIGHGYNATAAIADEVHPLVLAQKVVS